MDHEFINSMALLFLLTIYINSFLTLFLGKTKTVTISYPTHWEDMKGKPIFITDVKKGSYEWQSVEQHFRTTLKNRIMVIKRVQNVYFWEPYML